MHLYVFGAVAIGLQDNEPQSVGVCIQVLHSCIQAIAPPGVCRHAQKTYPGANLEQICMTRTVWRDMSQECRLGW